MIPIFSTPFWDLVNFALAPKPVYVPENSRVLDILIDEGLITIIKPSRSTSELRTWDFASHVETSDVQVELTDAGRGLIKMAQNEDFSKLKIDTKGPTFSAVLRYELFPAVLPNKNQDRNFIFLNLVEQKEHGYSISARGKSLCSHIVATDTNFLLQMLESAERSQQFDKVKIFMGFIPKVEWPVILSKLPANAATTYGKLLRGEI